MSDRFWSKVDRSGGPDACWPWTGGRQGQGYGSFHPVSGRSVLAHRYAWEETNGPTPAGAYVDHVCHNGTDCPGGRNCPHRRCCNVRHLEPTTPADNLDRSQNVNQHKTHCPKHHPYDAQNTYWMPPAKSGRAPRRGCRTCRREHDRARGPRRRGARHGG